jgi:hypothetical protein
MSLIAIDPGYARGKGCACAWFVRGVLRHAWTQRHDGALRDITPEIVAWEEPQVDRRTRGGVTANVVHLAAVGGTLAGRYAGATARVTAVTPQAWKRSAPKPVCHARLWRVLSPGEREELGGGATAEIIETAQRAGALARWAPGRTYYPAAWAGADLLDAVGIGLHVLRRTT